MLVSQVESVSRQNFMTQLFEVCDGSGSDNGGRCRNDVYKSRAFCSISWKSRGTAIMLYPAYYSEIEYHAAPPGRACFFLHSCSGLCIVRVSGKMLIVTACRGGIVIDFAPLDVNSTLARQVITNRSLPRCGKLTCSMTVTSAWRQSASTGSTSPASSSRRHSRCVFCCKNVSSFQQDDSLDLYPTLAALLERLEAKAGRGIDGDG